MSGTRLLLGAGLALGAYLIFVFNLLIGRKNAVARAFSSLDALLKKRYDLIPNLVVAVKAFMQHERATLEEITALRAQALQEALTPERILKVNARIGGLLGGVCATIENYPEIKAGEHVLRLQAALNEVEEQISAGRRAYNAAVVNLNNALEMFPSNLVGALFGFRRAPLFEAAHAERAAVSASVNPADRAP
jgi:LemA protein